MSDKKEWTPGPWAYHEHGVGERVVYDVANQSAICVFDDDRGLFAFDENYSVSSEAEANARLISASPDMYEALENIVLLINDFREFGSFSEYPFKIDDAIEAAENSLKKARGETE